jgi:hypothetical protein
MYGSCDKFSRKYLVVSKNILIFATSNHLSGTKDAAEQAAIFMPVPY